MSLNPRDFDEGGKPEIPKGRYPTGAIIVMIVVVILAALFFTALRYLSSRTEVPPTATEIKLESESGCVGYCLLAAPNESLIYLYYKMDAEEPELESVFQVKEDLSWREGPPDDDLRLKFRIAFQIYNKTAIPAPDELINPKPLDSSITTI